MSDLKSLEKLDKIIEKKFGDRMITSPRLEGEKILELKIPFFNDSEFFETLISLGEIEKLTLDFKERVLILDHSPVFSYLNSQVQKIIIRIPYVYFDDSLNQFDHLYLRLTDSDLEDIPESVFNLTKLKGLDLSGTKITSLPDSIGNLVKLEILNFGYNANLEILPEAFWTLTELKELDLSRTKIKSLPDSIGNLIKLESLKLSSNSSLDSLPEAVGKLKELKELFLVMTKIKSLPDSIGNLVNLETLNLSQNSNLEILPDAVWKLTELKKLILFRTKIKTLPESIGNLVKLETLILSDNYRLEILPGEIGKLTELKELVLRGMKIKSLPDFIGNLEKLERLDLSQNSNLESLPEAIGKLKELKRLILCRTKIITLPESIGNLVKLETLDLSDNYRLESLPETIGKLTELKTLFFRLTKMKSVPDFIGNLVKLERLDLSRNKNLESLSDTIGKLVELKTLVLSGTNIKNLPDSIGNLVKLEELNLCDNDNLEGLSEATGRLIELKQFNLSRTNIKSLPNSIENLVNLKRLELSGNENVKNLPDVVGKLKNLEELDLSYTNIESLPDSIVNLVKLEALDLSFNDNLKNLSDAISQLKELKKLNLSSTKIESLPDSILHLVNLEILNLDNNYNLEILPDEVGNLKELKKLDLSWTKIKTIPDSIARLENLEELNLNSSEITEIPNVIANLKKLSTLDLSNNSISNLPEWITDLDLEISLKSLGGKIHLAGNPIETPPLEIVALGNEAIKDYFRQIKEQGVDYIFEAKLLIVGEPGSGKTSFARKLMDENSELPKPEETTWGIDVIPYSFEVDKAKIPKAIHNDLIPDKVKIRLNTWDFAGQDIYHSTHRFFLTKRSLYVLVSDERKEDTDFKYWLQMVEKFGSDSPLLILQNQKEGKTRDIGISSLKSSFPNLKDSYSVNFSKIDTAYYALKNAVEHYACCLPQMGEAVPSEWKLIRDELEKLPDNFIIDKVYYNICDNNGVKEKESKRLLSRYFHDLGIFLHFQEDPFLRDTVFLKSAWVTKAVYMIVESSLAKDGFGRLTVSDLDTIWRDSDYYDMHSKFVELMKQFLILYETEKKEYVIPQLLKNDPPEYEWNSEENLKVKYEYRVFMPKGILWQLIVKLHSLIQGQLVWKRGVVLKKDEALARVIEVYERGIIEIHIQGSNKRELMTIISHFIDSINSKYEKLEVKKLIPCNCEECDGAAEPAYFDYNNLTDRQENGKKDIECSKKPYRRVLIRQLLDAVFAKESEQEKSGGDSIYNTHIYGDLAQLNQGGLKNRNRVN